MLDLSKNEVHGVIGRSAANSSSARRNALLIVAGAALLASAVAVRNRAQEAERDNPPLGSFIDVEGVRLHYLERGQGQPLVLLHGDGSMIQDFALSGLIDIAAQKYRVIAFDRPGYGYSERPRTTVWTPQAQAELLHFALHRLGIERPIVLGHSWGTLVAISLALQAPEYVKSLVLLSGYYYPTARLDVPLLSPPAIPVIGDLLRYTISPLLGRMIWPAMRRRLFSPAPVPQKFMDDFPAWMSLRPSQLRASAGDAAMMIPAAYALHDRYRDLTMPVVIVAGDSDRHADMHVHSAALHEDIPHSTLHVIHGAGHMIHHVAPDAVMNAIDEAAQAARAERRVTGPAAFPTAVQPA